MRREIYILPNCRLSCIQWHCKVYSTSGKRHAG